jgi:hypothetical protein
MRGEEGRGGGRSFVAREAAEQDFVSAATIQLCVHTKRGFGCPKVGGLSAVGDSVDSC